MCLPALLLHHSQLRLRLNICVADPTAYWSLTALQLVLQFQALLLSQTQIYLLGPTSAVVTALQRRFFYDQ